MDQEGVSGTDELRKTGGVDCGNERYVDDKRDRDRGVYDDDDRPGPGRRHVQSIHLRYG